MSPVTETVRCTSPSSHSTINIWSIRQRSDACTASRQLSLPVRHEEKAFKNMCERPFYNANNFGREGHDTAMTNVCIELRFCLIIVWCLPASSLKPHLILNSEYKYCNNAFSFVQYLDASSQLCLTHSHMRHRVTEVGADTW